MNANARTVRLFLSSTFRDFGEERDLLVRQVFPALRAQLKDRFVELVDVDLRWGITVEQAERGEVLPICLAEIDRARPYFIGMLGERYGWIPPPDGFAPDLIERQPWLKKHQGGKSVTELEILHGVLNNRSMKGRAFFYFRSPGYAKAKGGEYVPATPEDRNRQRDLKRRIQASGYPVVGYRDPASLAKRLERDLWKLLDAEFPASSVPDAFEREAMRHEAYATPRRRLYLGGERYQAQLAAALESGEQRVVIEGASGGGKSALLANFFEGYRKRFPKHQIHEHYLGASADAGDPHALVRRLCEFIKRQTNGSEEIESDPQKLMDSLPLWLATASAWARKRRTRFVFVLDALNSLTDQQDLRWWPAFLPQGLHFVVSCLPGPVLQALKDKAQGLQGQSLRWKGLTVKPLTKAERKNLLTTYLARFNKTLPRDLTQQVMAHPLSGNPLFIRTLAEELRLFGLHEELTKQLAHYLSSQTVDDLFEKVIERVEGDCGKRAVKATLTAIWASRAGLTEKEILGIVTLKPATWAPIRNALDEALMEADGKIFFTHDYMRIAVRDRYLVAPEQPLRVHAQLAQWFSTQPPQLRRAKEEPWQWRQARAHNRLRACLANPDLFGVLDANRLQVELLDHWSALEGALGLELELEGPKLARRWSRQDAAPQKTRVLASWAKFLTYASRYKAADQVFAWVLHRARWQQMDTDWREETRMQQARLLLALARYEDASAIHREVYESRKRRLGLQHRKTTETLQYMVSTLYEQGQYRQALPLAQQVIEAFRSAVGSTAAETLDALNNEANLHIELGNFQRAADMHREVLRLRKTTQGAAGPEYAQTLNNLGRSLQECGALHDAERCFHESIQLYEQALGSYSADLLKPLSNLGLLLTHYLGHPEGVEFQRRALAVAERMLPADHPELARLLINLSAALVSSDEKKPLVSRALGICRTRLGAHRFTVASLNHLAAIHDAEGDLEQARQCFEESARMAREIGGEISLLHSECLMQLGDMLYQHDLADQALPLLERSLAIQRKTLSPDHPVLTRNIMLLAYTVSESGDHERAFGLLREALDLFQRSYGQEHQFNVGALTGLADEARALGRFEDAIDFANRALSILRKDSHGDDAKIGEILWGLGDSLLKAGQPAQAVLVIEQELAIARSLEGDDSESVARSRWKLGVLLRECRHYVDARAHLQSAQKTLASLFGPKSEELARLWVSMGQVELATNRVAQAQNCHDEAAAIIASLPSVDTETTNSIEQLFHDLERRMASGA